MCMHIFRSLSLFLRVVLFPCFRSSTTTRTTISQCSLYDDNISSSISVNNKSLCEMDVHEMRIKSTIERTQMDRASSSLVCECASVSVEVKMIQRHNIWKTTCGNKCVYSFFFLSLSLPPSNSLSVHCVFVLAKFRMTHSVPSQYASADILCNNLIVINIYPVELDNICRWRHWIEENIPYWD